MHTQEIQEKYPKHMLLIKKAQGAANTLTGKIAMVLFFVNEKNLQWTEPARNRVLKTHHSAMEIVKKEAEKHAVSVTIDTIVEEVTVPMDCDRGEASEWVEYIMKQYDRKLFLGYKRHYLETLGYDQIAVSFVLNRTLRAYAISGEKYATPRTECSILGVASGERTMIHELFHQFGAMDLYYPDALVAAVRKHNYRSVMGYGSEAYVDCLSAYVIGWTDEIDGKTVALLEDTKHLKYQDILEGRRNA